MLTDDDRRLLIAAAETMEEADQAIRDVTALGRDPKAMAAAIRSLADRRRPDFDLDALEKAEQAMSRGPWTMDPTDDDILAPYDAVEHPDGTTGNVVGYLYVEQDFKGALALRNAAPALIAEVRALRAENACLAGERDQAVAHRAATNEEIKRLHAAMQTQRLRDVARNALRGVITLVEGRGPLCERAKELLAEVDQVPPPNPHPSGCHTAAPGSRDCDGDGHDSCRTCSRRTERDEQVFA